MKKKLLSVVLALAMVLSLMPAAFAATGTACPGGESCTHEAAIGETHYDTLKEAMNAATIGSTVKLLKNVNKQYVVTAKCYNVTVDLNGFNITTTEGAALKFDGKGNLPEEGKPYFKLVNTQPNKGGELLGKTTAVNATSKEDCPLLIGEGVTLKSSTEGSNLVEIKSAAYLPDNAINESYINISGKAVSYRVNAEDGEQRIYGAYSNAVAAAADKTATLMHDYQGVIRVDVETTQGILDLDGHTYTYSGNNAIVYFSKDTGTITIKNGTMISTNNKADGVDMLASNNGIILDDVKMTVSGETYGIVTNGAEVNNAVTLKNSTLNVMDGYGIYFPSSGSVTIEDSVINAKYSGVQMCSGSLEVKGDKTAITTTGEPQKKTESDGPIADGAAISVVNRSYPGGTPAMNVTGGTFNSNHANAVKAYTFSNDNKTEENWENAKAFVSISGGKFSNPESIKGYLDTGCALDETGKVVPADNSVASIGNKGYESLEAALAAVKETGGTITLLKNTILATAHYSIDKPVTINGTGIIHFIVGAGGSTHGIDILNEGSLTLDGVGMGIHGKKNAEVADNYDGIGIDVQNGGSLILKNNAELHLYDLDRAMVFSAPIGGPVESGKVVVDHSTIAISNIDGNVSNGGNWEIKNSATVTVDDCGDHGLSVTTMAVENSAVKVSNAGRTAIYGKELSFNDGANVTIENSGNKLPLAGWDQTVCHSPLEVNEKTGGSLVVAQGATVTVQNCVDKEQNPNNTVYLPNNATYTNNGTVNAEIVTEKAPENSFVVTLVSDGKTVGVQTVAKGSKFTLPAAPEKSNYTFIGWSYGSKTYKVGDKVTIDDKTTFTAKWSYNGSSSGGSSSSSYTVNVEDSKNGTVTASHKSASKNTTVTLTVKADKGYELDELTVTDKNGKELKLTDKGNGKYTFAMPASKVDVKATFAEIVEKPAYSDVSASAWYAKAVAYVTDKGYELDELTVTDKNGKELKLTDKGNGKYTFAMPASKVDVKATFAEIVEKPAYSDVSASAWYAKAVAYVTEKGMMEGSSGKFMPLDKLTRSQMAQVLFNLEGKKSVNYALTFGDMNGTEWYAEAVRWAASEQIVNGYDNGNFGPNDPITREQLVTILYRYAQYKGLDTATTEENLTSFADAAQVSGYAVSAMKWAVGAGVINGTDSGLAPKATATRAEVAQILMNFDQKF